MRLRPSGSGPHKMRGPDRASFPNCRMRCGTSVKGPSSAWRPAHNGRFEKTGERSHLSQFATKPLDISADVPVKRGILSAPQPHACFWSLVDPAGRPAAFAGRRPIDRRHLDFPLDFGLRNDLSPRSTASGRPLPLFRRAWSRNLVEARSAAPRRYRPGRYPLSHARCTESPPHRRAPISGKTGPSSVSNSSR